MAIDPRPSFHRLPAALAALAVAAVFAAPLVLTACGGATAPASRPESAPAAEAAGDAPEAAAETPESAPVNASPETAFQPPRSPKAPPEVEPRSEWTIDESVETPEELRGVEILAKFRKGADLVIIYRANNGDLYRRVEGKLGSYRRVEESKIEPEP